jgi:hypothetical protein
MGAVELILRAYLVGDNFSIEFEVDDNLFVELYLIF